jgi:hypothetical protein
MTNINILQNVVVDKTKIADLVKDLSRDEMKQLLGVKNSQAANIRRGEKAPSTNGLLRLMILRGVSAEDLATGAAK